MVDKRIVDLVPPVSKRTAGDVMVVDGVTTRCMTVRDAMGQKEPIQITSASGAIAAGENAAVIQRSGPAATAVQLPPVAAQDGIPATIFDWSTSVVEHAITITPDGTETIMGQSSLTIYSTPNQLAGVKLYPSTTLAGWYIAP